MGSEFEAAASTADVIRLSMISNVLSKTESGFAADLAKIAAVKITEGMRQAQLSGWSVAWGPMVFKDNDVEAGGPDLVAYVANKSDTYVIAIAGTHKDSHRAQYVYDIKILKNVDFEAWRNQTGAVKSNPKIDTLARPDKARIAEGTALGVHDLANAKTTLGPSSGTDIVTFLQSLKQGSKLIYTGHSLGAALSPTLALGLLKELKQINPKDVSTLPTGGPAPGNAKFVDLFANAFPANGGFNQNISNTRDPVTFAWNVDANKYPKRCMQYLLELFGQIPSGPLQDKIKIITGFAQAARLAGMTYAFLPSASFTGTLAVKYNPPIDWDQYMHNSHTTHVDDYMKYWGIKAGELDGIDVALPFPDGSELAIFLKENGFDEDGNYVRSKDSADTDGKTMDGNSEL